ncbi:MAG: hypothetical protein EHM41_00240 [Chloroflexi bacterium]|nr:MAG: hypothetical protein EHM41_00240 [Chloroflexota bacterium]
MKLANTCNLCKLSKSRRKIVWGEGPEDAGIMFIGEGPGKWEDSTGRPFVEKAKAGEEHTAYLRRNGLNRKDTYTTNIVKCRVPDDEDPDEECVKACSYWLNEEIRLVDPSIIVCLGALATHKFIPDLDMELCHGIGYKINGRTIIPCYHPAAGLHRPEIMALCQNDYKQVVKIMYGQVKPKPAIYWDTSTPVYEAHTFTFPEQPPKVIAIDTEWARGKGWNLTACWEHGKAYFLLADNPLIAQLDNYIRTNNITVLLHNALYDLPVLKDMGLIPDKIVDTMILAYLLQDEPQGLKALAYRVTGRRMFSYEETIRPARQQKALDYLCLIASESWPKPEAIPYQAKGVWKVKNPWPINKKATRILSDYSKSPDIELRERWLNIDPNEGRGIAEAKFGLMPDGELCDIPFEDALKYACQDAEMTLAVYEYLWPRIHELELEDVFWMDVSILPMVMGMMEHGIKADPDKFRSLTEYYNTKKELLQKKVYELTDRDVQLGSHQQVRKLLFEDLGLKAVKFTKTGLEQADDKVLAMLQGTHPVIEVIRDWRGYDKLINTYSGPMPNRIAADGRIHPKIKVTRADTGRLSTAEPNLMAVPNQDEEGRKMREGFVAEEGYVLVEGDYSQIELRLLAKMANEPSMIKTFTDGKDIHTMTACEVFGLPESQIDKYKHRLPCKRVNFGIPYGTEAQGLMETLIKDGADPSTWTLTACEDLIKAWFDRFSRVRDYIAEIHAYARRHGYVRDMFGRIKLTPGVYSPNKWVVMDALRQAQNQPIQASAQGIIKLAMGKLTPIYRQLRSEGIDIRSLIQIHDALLNEIPEQHVVFCNLVTKSVMETTTNIGIPTPVDFKEGTVWGLMKGEDD